ncbi:MAG: molybdenum cofactor biosynthesis protein MoaE [Gammaproteobacteria bacterium]|nr:MAG: molybdenum cofactor biosynthesis protein MoaE [Gammaproteobacteria bacterium]
MRNSHMKVQISVQKEDFDIGALHQHMYADAPVIGAVASFVGLVRDFSEREGVIGLELEHYPGMTEKALHTISADAAKRWPLNAVTIVHRIGPMKLGEQIVAVLVSSAHREAAFEACAFIMDFLKVRAPFWKKELTAAGAHWVDAREKDTRRAAGWVSSGD